MLEQALALARQGFLVFPVKPGRASPPLLAEWQIAATTDESRIRAWWSRWPTANIGIHCEDLLVLDVDVKHGKKGYESLDALEQEIQLDATLEVSTPTGGRHIYYRCPGGVRNGVDVLGSGLDVRSTNGYVVGPGSKTEVGEYVVYADEPVVDAPGELLGRIRTVHAPVATPAETVETDPDTAVARAKAFLAGHPPAIEGAGGDHHTFRTVCRVRDFGVPEDRAADALADWNERCVPPWAPTDLLVKIRNAYRYAENPAGVLSPEGMGFQTVAPDVGTPAPQPTVRTDLLHPADVALDAILSPEYLIKGVLERQSNAVLFGHWNVGKTFVVLDMAAAIATGERWFERRVRQGRVLYLGYEGLRAMKKRMIALREKHPKLKDRETPFEWHPLRIALTRPEGRSALIAILKAYMERHGGAPDLIIIDPIANALGGDDADATLMGLLNECVAELIQKQRCTVLRVHHSGHSNQERARGHSSLPAGVDTEIRVDEQEIALTKQRDDVRGKFFFNLKVVTLGVDTDGDDVSTCVVEQIEENPMSPTLTRPQQTVLDALVRMKGDGGRVSKTEFRDAAGEMDAAERREVQRILERKAYLRAEGDGWIICERGPQAIFD